MNHVRTDALLCTGRPRSYPAASATLRRDIGVFRCCSCCAHRTALCMRVAFMDGGGVLTTAMVVETDDVAEIVASLATDEVSTNGSFYVVELLEDGSDDFDWGFDDGDSTPKKSPYSLDFRVGTVYDMKVGDQDMRAVFQVNETGGSDPDSWDIHVVDQCELDTKNIDWNAVGTAVHSDEDPETMARREDIKRLVDGADEETLDLVEQVLETTDGSRDPGEHTVADLSAVPASVRKRAQSFAGAFGTAFERQTGSEPGVHLRAAALDAAVMFQKRQAQQGGDN